MNSTNDFFKKNWSAHTGATDIPTGLGATHVWLALGWHDIKQRYRRSVLGPFWFTISTLIMVGVLGILYSSILGQDIHNYLPYLGTGLVVWQFISTCAIEGSSTLIGAGYIIKQIKMPISVHVARMTWRNFIIMMHSLPVVFVFLIAFGHRPGPEILLIIPGLLVVLANATWMGLVLSIVCARYRDILPIVGNITQVAFFFTPVMWSADLLKDRRWAAELNPFYHLIQIIRAPTIGSTIEIHSWIWAISLAIGGFGFAQYLMNRTRNRVPYWL